MGTQEVKLERAGEKSAVDSLDPICSFIHNIIIQLESNQPIDVPSLCVLSFPPSAPQYAVAIARRRAPHLATTCKDTAAATVLS